MEYNVVYRGEFEAYIEADTVEEAIYQFKNGKKVEYKVAGELHEDFIQVFDDKGHEL